MGDGYEAPFADDVTEIMVAVVQPYDYVKNMLSPLNWTLQEGEL